MKRFTFLLWIACAGLVLAGLGSAAFADDGPDAGPSALERLSPEMREHLATQVPGWADLPKERQERIARNYLRVKDLPPEERLRLEERIEKLRHHREKGRGPSPHHRRRPGDEHHRRHLGERIVLVRAVGTVLWAKLPAETRQAVKDAVGPRGGRAVEMAYYRRLWDVIAHQKAKAGIPEIQVGEDGPDRLRRQVAAWRERAEAGDEKARLRLGYMAVGQELHQLVQRLEGVETLDEPTLQRVGTLLEERYPEAFQQARGELVKAARDPATLKRYVQRGQHQGRGRPEDGARFLLRALEQARPFLQRHPELAAKAEELRRELRKIARERGGDARGRGEGRHRGPGPRPPGPRGPGPRRPGGGGEEPR